MSLFAMFKSAGPTGFGHGSTAEPVTEGLSLAGQTILVTGCNSGIGQEACRVLALRGALVLGTARTKEKAAAACATFPGEAIGYSCELSDPSSVRGCVAAVEADGHRLDAIICNAGIMMLPKLEKSHGYELQFFTNHIGHFMLVTGLLEQLKDEGRVVMLSSEGHRSATDLGNGTTLNGSQTAVYVTPALAPGAHSITAVYNGDANNAPSTSPVLIQTIIGPTFSWTANGNTTESVLSGQSTTYNFTATPMGELRVSSAPLHFPVLAFPIRQSVAVFSQYR